MSDYGSPLFAALRADCAAAWRAYTEHGFVEQLADGSLPRAAFLRYLRQDYLFLVHFARAWALAVVKSDRIDEMRQAAAMVHALIDAEMRLHVATCAVEGLSEADLAATESFRALRRPGICRHAHNRETRTQAPLDEDRIARILHPQPVYPYPVADLSPRFPNLSRDPVGQNEHPVLVVFEYVMCGERLRLDLVLKYRHHVICGVIRLDR